MWAGSALIPSCPRLLAEILQLCLTKSTFLIVDSSCCFKKSLSAARVSTHQHLCVNHQTVIKPVRRGHSFWRTTCKFTHFRPKIKNHSINILPWGSKANFDEQSVYIPLKIVRGKQENTSERGGLVSAYFCSSYPALFPAVVQFKSLLLDHSWTMDVLLLFIQCLSSWTQCSPLTW